MDLMLKITLLISLAGVCYAGECCNGYYDVLGDWTAAQWCSDFCCGSSVVDLTCCSNILLQAPFSDRGDFCVVWWKHHVWAIVLIIVGNILILVCCCFCCYKCCCAQRNTTIVYQPGTTPMPGVTIQQVATSSQQSQMSYGYDQQKY